MKPLQFIVAFMLISCQSIDKNKSDFADIQLGMTKAEVISATGAPYWSDRKRGEDRWIYYMNPKTREDERVVYFHNNKVVRKGERIKPILSAEEMEQIKRQRTKTKPYKPKLSEEQLEKIIKKEIEQKTKKKTKRFEKI